MNIYDFDKTIYDGDSSIDFYFFSLRKKLLLIKYFPIQATALVMYLCHIIDKTKMKAKFFLYLKDIDAENYVNEFWKKNKNKIFDYYIKQKREDDIIISASPQFLLKPICDQLNIKHLIATTMDSKNGRIFGKNCFGEEKVKRLIKEYDINSCDEFYSDSNTDLPLAKISKKAYKIINGKIHDWN